MQTAYIIIPNKYNSSGLHNRFINLNTSLLYIRRFINLTHCSIASRGHTYYHDSH